MTSLGQSGHHRVGTMSESAVDDRVGQALAQEGDQRAGTSILDLRYGLEDRPGAIPMFLFGLQHVLVMFTAMVAAPLVIGQLLNLSPEFRTTMITGVMLGCGIGTIVSAIGVYWIGARLPLLLGAYAVYIGPVVAMAKATSLAAATTAMIIGGFVLFVLSPLLGELRAIVPPPLWLGRFLSSRAKPSSRLRSASPPAPTRFMRESRSRSFLSSAAFS